MTSSLIFWEILTFVVLMAVFLMLLPRINPFIRGLRESGEDREGSRSVTETMDRRYAQGEITREEYLTIRDDITRNPNA
jgi:uncharacterized membrane protein